MDSAVSGQPPCTIKSYMCKNAKLTNHSKAFFVAKYYQYNEILISAHFHARPH
jgi:hypothetical protein